LNFTAVKYLLHNGSKTILR